MHSRFQGGSDRQGAHTPKCHRTAFVPRPGELLRQIFAKRSHQPLSFVLTITEVPEIELASQPNARFSRSKEAPSIVTSAGTF